MTSIWVPFAYVTVLVGGMLMFSRYLRRQKQGKSAASVRARDLYITLLQADPPTDDKILMSALLCRAVTDVKRIWQLRDSKQALNILVQKGSLGDETVARFAAAEKELEAEVVDVVAEANTFKQGWGQWIFASASEIAQREKLRTVLEGLPKIKQEQGSSFVLLSLPRLCPSKNVALIRVRLAGFPDRICASLRATKTIGAPTPATAVPSVPAPSSTIPTTTRTPKPTAESSTTTALETALGGGAAPEGLINRAAVAAASIVQDISAEEEQSSGASTPVSHSGTPIKAGLGGVSAKVGED
ncbi:hypothetical protein QFC19_005747 [Naganishia cerealis]|uniref:Uncharacterized protein n=1 Tax=Naganishia cerealis TaxID=610337 RepID=A0ACC2VNE6_9TREE|nr:hypothetical protein QFC19_005747 [Naganishia cerealis]